MYYGDLWNSLGFGVGSVGLRVGWTVEYGKCVLTDFRRGWLAENTRRSIRRTVDVSIWSLLDLFWGGRVFW